MSFAEQKTEARYTRASDAVDVFLVEDHGFYRQGLAVLLEGNDPLIHIVGDTESAEEALDRIPDLLPDVVLMDIHLPEMTGIEAIRQLSVLCPSVSVLVISGSADDDDVMEALLAGASGYMLKTAPITTSSQRSVARRPAVPSSHPLSH